MESYHPYSRSAIVDNFRITRSIYPEGNAYSSIDVFEKLLEGFQPSRLRHVISIDDFDAEEIIEEPRPSYLRKVRFWDATSDDDDTDSYILEPQPRRLHVVNITCDEVEEELQPQPTSTWEEIEELEPQTASTCDEVNEELETQPTKLNVVNLTLEEPEEELTISEKARSSDLLKYRAPDETEKLTSPETSDASDPVRDCAPFNASRETRAMWLALDAAQRQLPPNTPREPRAMRLTRDTAQRQLPPNAPREPRAMRLSWDIAQRQLPPNTPRGPRATKLTRPSTKPSQSQMPRSASRWTLKSATRKIKPPVPLQKLPKEIVLPNYKAKKAAPAHITVSRGFPRRLGPFHYEIIEASEAPAASPEVSPDSTTRCKDPKCPIQTPHNEGRFFASGCQATTRHGYFGYSGPPPEVCDAWERVSKRNGWDFADLSKIVRFQYLHGDHPRSPGCFD